MFPFVSLKSQSGSRLLFVLTPLLPNRRTINFSSPFLQRAHNQGTAAFGGSPVKKSEVMVC